ncbi:xanthine dehydrogenase subunit D [Alkalicoccus urumqiensis]|uniref:Xanthine dehydrogenase subunit D n=1 Tax=Alkalicoccus urumqiensis TaxID=1548213 RepID=A0A2P6MLR7_ALKUR|nr:xanthine dehydrogenase subunit D [Alkalicoccus urumqiensis]PRO67180.1 xanthine dehydrogenase subunit D [Alkalicoccus urumqiensis]
MKLNDTAASWRKRPDGSAKIDGSFQYLTDKEVPGCLHARVKRSGIPHARLRRVYTAEAEAMPGVRAVLTADDVPGLNGFGIADPNQPVFVRDHIRFEADAVAAVAADTPEIAQAALDVITIDVEPLPVLDTPEKALHPEAVKLHPDGNILHETFHERGDIQAGFAEAAVVVEETYETPRQMHVFMEMEGGLFVPETDGTLTVYAPTQHGYKDRMQLSRILGWEEEQIRIVSSPIGGSFGGKDELNVQPFGALLALATGQPVKIHYSRKESVRAGLKRHPMKITMRTGVDKDGLITAHEALLVSDTGAYATLGGPVLQFATEHTISGYIMPNVRIEGLAVYTNNGISGEFRGFGGNQALFALEGQMDRLAEKLGVDPWEMRRRNLRQENDPGPLGQRVAPNDGPRGVWEAVQQSPLWKRPSFSRDKQEPWIVRGTGASIAMHGSGLGYGIPDPAGGELRLTPEGKIEAAFGHEEFGQGLVGTLEIMLLRHFHCAENDLLMTIGDTSTVPKSGSSTASRSTNMIWQALEYLVPPFKNTLFKRASALTGAAVENMETGAEGIRHKKSGALLVSYRRLAAEGSLKESTEFHFPLTPDPVMGGHFLYGSTAVIAEVEVNQLTGTVRVTGADHAVAAGSVVNPLGYLGQIEGGSIMALGFTLTEDAVMNDGVYQTGNLDAYLIPTIQDVPKHQAVEAVERLPEGDTYGPRGVGEIGSVALAPAICEAIYQAAGVRVTKLPVEREKLIREEALLEAWMDAEGAETG